MSFMHIIIQSHQQATIYVHIYVYIYVCLLCELIYLYIDWIIRQHAIHRMLLDGDASCELM
jgi:uncharacterized membrane protein